MSPIRFITIPTATVTDLQSGGADANGQPPERATSDGDGVPCRHCLAAVAATEPYLILAHRPFTTIQPYAECGPIFLHADACEQYSGSDRLPTMLGSEQYILRGYNREERIIYGTGQVVPTADIPRYAETLFEQDEVSFIHVRSASNNCFQCRIERAK